MYELDYLDYILNNLNFLMYSDIDLSFPFGFILSSITEFIHPLLWFILYILIIITSLIVFLLDKNTSITDKYTKHTIIISVFLMPFITLPIYFIFFIISKTIKTISFKDLIIQYSWKIAGIIFIYYTLRLCWLICWLAYLILKVYSFEYLNIVFYAITEDMSKLCFIWILGSLYLLILYFLFIRLTILKHKDSITFIVRKD